MYRTQSSFLKANSAALKRHLFRKLYSKTGEWPKWYDSEVRKELESYWKPKMRELDSKINKETNVKDKEKYYVLSMFPYPSGKLHMGHVRVYTISDTMARFQRANGKHVIHPMGWDAFGLPAENAAIDRGKSPDEWTKSNIDNMKQQLDDLLYNFEYDRGFATCDPDYYKWTQFIFLKMWEHGLVYQKMGAVNWDPVDQTVLADEQIDENGCSWRSGAKVERKFLKQWYIKTSQYAKSLIDGLEEVDSDLWNDIIDLQRHWIGKCDGVRFELQLRDDEGMNMNEQISVFSRTPEGIYGASHILISPDHFLNQEQYYLPHHTDALTTSWFDNLISMVKRKDENREVIPLKVVAQNHMKGTYIPIFLHKSWDFGEHLDSHLGMPCFNKEDYEFANSPDRLLHYSPVLDKYGLLQNSGKYSGMTTEEGAEEICKQTRLLRKGGYLTSEKCRDWCISRQRYWGTPIPMLHCKTSGAVPVPYDQLPVVLPKVENFRGVNGKSPLSTASEDWLHVPCPKSSVCMCVSTKDDSLCCEGAVRETDTMDTFVDSSWYFLRYLSPRFNDGPYNPDDAFKHMPVDLYIGGKEHAIMHLYYARFFCHFLHDIGYLPQREPFKNLLTQGMVKGQTYREPVTGRYVPREEVDFSGSVPKDKSGSELVVDWEKMSKSKYNGVDPQEVVDTYGTDTTRLCVLGGVAPKSDRHWSNDLFHAIQMWQGRVWKTVGVYKDVMSREKEEVDPQLLIQYSDEVYDARNYFIKEVDFHMNRSFLISTAISRLQGFTRVLRSIPVQYIPHIRGYERALNDLIIMISVFAPMFGAELRHALGKPPQVINEWPVVDPEYRIHMRVKINRRRAFEVGLNVPLDQLETVKRNDALELAQSSPKWKEVMGDMAYDYALLSITPKHRVELNIVSNALKKEKKEKKRQKMKEQQNDNDDDD